MNIKEKKGFTLIELIIVIVILGILAAIAIPKFIGFSKEAKISALHGIEGSLKSAMSIVHSKWLVSGANSDTVTLEDGTTVDVYNADNDSRSGYPKASNDGILKAIEYSTSGGLQVSANNDIVTFKYSDNCKVEYKADNSSSIPAVIVTTSGCK